MSRVTGLLMVGLVVLATIWVYNRYSGKSIGALGAKAA